MILIAFALEKDELEFPVLAALLDESEDSLDPSLEVPLLGYLDCLLP